MSLYAAKCSRSFPSNKLTVIKMDDPPALKGPFPVPITPLARVDTGSLTVSHLRVTPVMFFHHSGVFTLRVFTEGDLVTLTNKSSSIFRFRGKSRAKRGPGTWLAKVLSHQRAVSVSGAMRAFRRRRKRFVAFGRAEPCFVHVAAGTGHGALVLCVAGALLLARC